MKQLLLTMCGLIVLSLMGSANGSQSSEPTLPEARRPREVKGLGADEAKARDKAVREATEIVMGLMIEHNLTAFKLDEKYVRANLLVDEGKPGKDVHNELLDKPFKEWIVTFKDTNWWKDIVRRDEDARRMERANSRQTTAKRLAGSLFVVLCIAYGCVRLNRLTRGRHSFGLQILGVFAACVILAGVWSWLLQ